MQDEIVVALAGNPNVGKSTLFNMLTGETAHVANWPGVTVELKEGHAIHHGKRIRFVDLPGTYSLTAGGAEEIAEAVARKFIVEGRPDVLIVITDATALDRTLYLVVRAMELTPNVIVVVNFMDCARRRAIHVDLDGLSSDLGVPFVGTVATKGEGIGVLFDRILEAKKRRSELKVDYNGLEPYIREIQRIVEEKSILQQYPSRFVAVGVLEGDSEFLNAVKGTGAEEVVERARRELNADPSQLVIEARYKLVEEVVRRRVKRTSIVRQELSERMDKAFLHPVAGPIISVLLLISLFSLIFALNTGFPVNVLLSQMGLEEQAAFVEEHSISGIMSYIFDWISSQVSKMPAPEWALSLLTDGIIAGLSGVLSFLPLIFLVFVLLGALQDTGVLARIAVSFDRFLRPFGLSGKSVFPASIGFGCNVPAVMATRALDDDRERASLAMSAPFIPCQARLVVLLALSSAAFSSPLAKSSFLMLLYFLSVLVFLISTKIMQVYVLKVRWKPELLLEIPPYHVPSLRVIWWYTRVNTMHFLRKAGAIIFPMVIAFWFLLHIGPSGYTTDYSNSIGAIMGRYISLITSPIGLSDWRASLALLSGFLAKEGVLGTINTITGLEDPVAAIRSILGPAEIVSLSVVMNFYLPCVATAAVLLKELRSARYLLIVIAYELLVAYLLAFVSYYVFSLFLH